MKSIADLLAEHELFVGLDPSYAELLAGCATNVALPAGKPIFREGEPADNFWLIRRGRVALELHSPGTGQLLIETLDDNEVLGWSWLLPPYRWHFDAVALEDTGAVMFDGACVRAKFDADPRLGYQLLSRFMPLVVDRLQATRLRLLDLYGRDGE